MATHSRAALIVLAEGAFWSEPRDSEHWRPSYVGGDGPTAASFLSFLGRSGIT